MEDSDERVTVTRRPLLAALGTAALAGCVGESGDGDGESGDGDDGATEESADDAADEGPEWDEAAADERIREHRTAPLEVEVVDGAGDPVEGAAIEVAMREHAFGFGAAVDAPTLIEESDPGDEYRERIPELFNTAVMENHHKWRFWEEEQELADEATAWLVEEDLTLRGHACLWANVDAWAVPPDVVEAMGVAWPAQDIEESDPDPEYVRQRSFEHLEAIISHYADFREYGSVIDQWDVVNEVVHEPGMITAIEDDDVTPVEAPVLAEWYRRAEEVAPDDVATDVNDYNTIEGPYQAARDQYHDQIEFLRGEEVGLDGVGLQSHFSEDGTIDPQDAYEAIDRYANHGTDVRITEFDMADDAWDDEDKAAFFERFLKTAFSHPAVTDFVLWGFWDGRHWRDDAPLFYEDWEPKPAYDVYTGLVFDEWWTEESGQTDADGRFATDGFLGQYEVTVGGDVTESVTLDEGGTAVEVTLGEN